MPSATSIASWFSILVFLVPLAVALLASLPSGAVLQIAAHTCLLVIGAVVALLVRPRGS